MEHDILDYLSKIFRSGDATTPKHIVEAMLDLIPEEVFADPTKTFLCPATKDGVFLREILHKILYAYRSCGLDSQSPEAIRAVLENRIFGIALTYKDYMMSRRTLYGCTDDENEIGYRDIDNIFYDTTETLSEKQKDKLGNTFPYQYTFIKMDEYLEKAKTANIDLLFQVIGDDNIVLYEKKEKLFDKLNRFKNMKFDVIIGNPPYQISDGGAQASAMPVYHKFIQQAKTYNPCYLTMIVPSRWFAGGKGLDSFRDEMLHDNRIRIIHDFIRADDIFPSVEIKGGVCYFLWNRDCRGDCVVHTHTENEEVSIAERPLLEKNAETFIRFNESISILRKVQEKNETSFSSIVSARKPFGLATNYLDFKNLSFEKSLKIYANQRVGYIEKNKIEKNSDWIDKFKIYIPKAIGAGNIKNDWLKPILGEPYSCCTETYLVIGPCKTKNETENVISYIQTKFFHLLLSLKKITQDTTKEVYQFVPLQDFSESWTDEKLYAKYGLSQKEIAFIESMIRPMDLTAKEESEGEGD